MRGDRPPVNGRHRAHIRPFVGGARRAGPPAAAVPHGEAGGVRPYSLTRGRVTSADSRVRVETMLVARAGAADRLGPSGWEKRRLLAMAATPTSVAELAVGLGVPVGVALVLVGDLARDGLLQLSAPLVAPRDDVALIRRLIDGVGAL